MGHYPIHVQFAMALLLLCAHKQRPVSSFAPAASPLLISRRQQHHDDRSITKKLSTFICAATLTSRTSITNISTQETSIELLRILQGKVATGAKDDAGLDDQINPLVRTLIASKSPFDPAKCIDGPLFASIHFIGNTPLWEKIASAGGVRNVKGQKYTLGAEDVGDTFVNYAEIWGENFYLKAVGNCKDEGPVVESPFSSTATDDDDEKPSLSSNPLGALVSLFNPGKGGDMKQQLLPTPYNYSANVEGASIVVFQKFSLDLSIEGTGTVRVLYADENLRIFLSPTDTNVTKGGGDWESEGLIVVQARVDLVYDDWVDQL